MSTSTRKTRVKALCFINGKASRDVSAFCPKCKALEMLNLNGEELSPTQRFIQRANAIYHTCGSDLPCRLYSLS
jgi:hypothetical protein